MNAKWVVENILFSPWDDPLMFHLSSFLLFFWVLSWAAEQQVECNKERITETAILLSRTHHQQSFQFYILKKKDNNQVLMQTQDFSIWVSHVLLASFKSDADISWNIFKKIKPLTIFFWQISYFKSFWIHFSKNSQRIQ